MMTPFQNNGYGCYSGSMVLIFAAPNAHLLPWYIQCSLCPIQMHRRESEQKEESVFKQYTPFCIRAAVQQFRLLQRSVQYMSSCRLWARLGRPYFSFVTLRGVFRVGSSPYLHPERLLLGFWYVWRTVAQPTC